MAASLKRTKRAQVVAVIGAGDAPRAVCELAFAVGREIARRGAVLINGGRTGVMESAASGAREEGGHTIGILPGYDRRAANPHIEFAIATGIGEARNAVIVASADAVIALAGEGGTLAEIGFAKKFGKPIVALDSWPEIGGLHRAETPADAVTHALKLAASNSRRRK
ncbi:MAG TPA: TIGR00725 family protein [Candidatus Acidoferrales bacterium]|nr:TIGR00725 family protein [Candidatus Acidoferrales bacterium]